MKISKQFIDKYNQAGPRYTSYPPATVFTSEYNISEYKKSIVRSNSEKPENISIYIHIPFCPHLCSFCGCNTIVGKGNFFIDKYIDALITEINSVAKLIDKQRLVSQVHWGGGTPNSIPFKYIEKVMNTLKNNFNFVSNPEIAIECSPAYLNISDIDKLSSYGFNRMSLGVQDFNNEVLKLVNRRPPKHKVSEIVAKLKDTGFTGVNIDLIYGLPGQTAISFADTVKKTIAINPDRIVTFSYAHVPWVKEYQKVLEDIGLPKPEEKMEMLTSTLNTITANGYVAIGMDHFAKPEDELSIALNDKKLHRNFQGYCTLETTGQVYGFGTSAISQLAGAYAQNEKNPEQYVEMIEENNFATIKGYNINSDQQIIRQVINEVMCNNYLNFNQMSKKFNLPENRIKQIVGFDKNKFDEFIKDDLIELNNNEISVKSKGRLIVRNIAMQLDPALKTGKQLYSKTV